LLGDDGQHMRCVIGDAGDIVDIALGQTAEQCRCRRRLLAVGGVLLAARPVGAGRRALRPPPPSPETVCGGLKQ
ncbi:hypothetical protein, partial [Nocardia cyriacigeorgica]|uniref:hypothetical protein n=1 Tax=Nocardia cyriacigeorgica TaxID=135487 RepID=UPI0024588631